MLNKQQREYIMNQVIMTVDHLDLVKEFDDGIKAFSSTCGTRVSLFAELPERDGNYFKISHWTSVKGKTLVEIADYIYNGGAS